MLARVVALSLISVQVLPFALAESGQTVIDAPHSDTSAATDIDASSQNDIAVDQQAGDGAQQDAEIDAAAHTTVEADQTVHGEHDIAIEQECATGTGNTLCFEDAAPVATTEAEQHIDASSHNDLNVGQHAGSGSTQSATVSGSAVTDVTATQTVTSDVIIDIFQDCTMQHGVCVQRALPEVLTRATQVIAASALNTLESEQTAGSGSTQHFSGDLTAQVNVRAEQVVSPRAFLELTQLCVIDVGMCVQRAIPLVQTAVEQVIDAQAHNNADIVQDGAHEADATLQSDADTNVVSTQHNDAQTTIDMIQQCGVERGLCLQVDGAGNPTYVFSDGDATTTGEYAGDLDETILQEEYSRRTVGIVASGICAGASTCSMVDLLLLWLFGPEPQPEAPSGSTVTRDRTGGNYARRGHETNVIGASMQFLAQRLEGNDNVAPPAFGGGEDASDDGARPLACSMRTRLLLKENGDGVWEWTASEIARLTGMSQDAAMELLRDPFVCPADAVAAAPVVNITLFPVAHDGPVSSNPFWNACVRGEHVSLADVRANPDRNEDGLPLTCGRYHTGSSWYHPDLSVFFTWDRTTGSLRLPDGYVPSLEGVASADERI